MNFEKACAEVDYIISNLNSDERARIPKDFIDFFKANKDIEYTPTISKDKPLFEQKILDETKAFLYIIYNKYLAQ